jgi:hypothetical protein
MNTSHGWARAQLKLRGIDEEYNSLREAYFISAIRKEARIEFKKHMASVVAAAGGDAKEAFGKYAEETFPELKEKRKDFMEENKGILEDLAGQEIDLSQYTRMDT